MKRPPKPTKRFVSIFSDHGFKATFGNRTSTLFLKKALQVILKTRSPIKEINFGVDSYIGLTVSSRGGAFDVTFTDENGKSYIVEMQMTRPKLFIHRAKWYGFLKYNTLVKKGDYQFDDLKPIIIISFIGGKAFGGKEFYHVCKLRNQHGRIIDKQITHVIIELGKWNKRAEEITSDFDKLIYFMKITDSARINEPLVLPSFMEEDWLKKALHLLDIHKLTPEEYEAYIKAVAYQKRIEMEIKAEKEEYAQKLLAIERKKREKVVREKRKEAREKRKALLEKEKEIKERKKAILEKEKIEKELAFEKQRADKELALEKQRTAEQIALERKKAIQLERKQAIQQLLVLKVLSDEQIAQMYNMSLKEVLVIKKSLSLN